MSSVKVGDESGNQSRIADVDLPLRQLVRASCYFRALPCDTSIIQKVGFPAFVCQDRLILKMAAAVA
jgi:hypothetical protein